MDENPQVMKCMFCDEPEFGPGVVEPLCEKHLELTIFIWRLRKRGEPISAVSIIRYMERVHRPVAIRPEEVPALLEQMHTAEGSVIELSQPCVTGVS